MILSLFLELLYPSKCVFCDCLLEKEETELCSHCRKELPYCEEKVRQVPFSKDTAAVFYYEAQVRESILRYKFRRNPQYSHAYGRLLAMKIAEQGIDYDVISHVPVSRRRHRSRGYDQAQRLARATARELGGTYQRLLKKVRNNPAQSGISRPEQRRANVLGVYKAVKLPGLRGKSVLLIDDVMTTGATLSECCRTLLDAGAAQVSCATLAAVRRDMKQQVRK
ncbi:MAG: ComF family protein [Ruminococcaceae bacterium]|nr:ComF family protein [Oscillospiraceae bacterium]